MKMSFGKYLKNIIICTAAVCAVSAASPCFARELDCTLAEGRLSVSGKAENDYVNIIVMPMSEDGSNVSLALLSDNRHFAFSMENTAGTVSKELYLPEDFAAGAYKLVSFDGINEEIYGFVYYALPINSLSDELTAASGGAERTELIKENAEALGIDSGDAALFSGILDNLGSLKENYSQAIIILNVRKGKLDEVIDLFAGSLGIDEEEYNALSDELKQSLSEALAEKTITDFQKDYKETLDVCRLGAVKTENDLLELLKSLNADFTYYNKLNETKKSSCLRTLLNNMPGTTQELAARFEADAKAAYGSSTSSGTGSGAGGGGGSGSGGGASGITLTKKDEADMIKNQDSSVFPDTVNHWAKEYIETLCGKSVVKGYDDGSFYPDKSISRAEFSAMMVRALDIPSGNSAVNFADVGPEDWFAQYVLTLAAEGIVSGYDGYFRPDDDIKREDMAVIIYRLLLGRNIAMEKEADFSDISEADAYAAEAIRFLGGVGVLNGSGGNIAPQTNLTRAEAAAVICRVIGMLE